MKLNNNDLQNLEELPQGWAVTTLGDILPLTYGKALKKETRDESGNVPVYGSSGQVGVHSVALTKKPALIVGRKGSVGEVYRSPVPCWPIDTVYFAEDHDDGDLKYFEYLLKGLKLLKLDKSTAVPGLSRDDYNAVEVAIAPLDQQKRIVAEIEKQFSRLDEGVANLKRVKANLKRYKAAVLKAAVEGRLVETEAATARREGRSYETGAQLLQRILETRRSQWIGKGKYKEPAAPDTTDLPELPEGWTWCGFEQVSISDKHALKAGPFGSALKKEMYVESGYKIYGQEQVISGDPTFGDYYIDETKYRELESCAVKPGDLLISLVGTAGKVLVLPLTAMPGIINPRLLKLSLNSTLIAPTYAAYMLQSAWARHYFKLQAHGGTMEILNLGIIKTLPVPLPPLDEQHRIVAEVDRRLSLVRETEIQVNANLTRAERLLQSILSSAFSGGVAQETPLRDTVAKECM